MCLSVAKWLHRRCRCGDQTCCYVFQSPAPPQVFCCFLETSRSRWHCSLTQLRDMTIMSEYGVDRWRERDLDAGFRYPTECRYAGSANIIDAVFIRSGGDADRRLGEFMINVSVKARHESLP